MSEKSSVSILHELCRKQNRDPPFFDLISSADKSFTYALHAFDMIVDGTGHSKKAARNQASVNLLSKFDCFCTDKSKRLSFLIVCFCLRFFTK